MEQKIIKIGNSLGVILPKSVRGNLKAGQKVNISSTSEGVLVSDIKPADVNPEFMKMVEEFADEHEDILQKLTNR